MKPEDLSACESAIFYYKKPWFATADKIRELYNEYNVGLYTTMTFTFIHCIEPPLYYMPAENHKDTLHLCGGKYLFESFPNYTESPYILDTNTYPYSDGRQYYHGHGRIFDFFEGEYSKKIKGIIIGPVQDFYDRYAVKCSNKGIVTFGDMTIKIDEMSFLPQTDWIDLCTVTREKYL